MSMGGSATRVWRAAATGAICASMILAACGGGSKGSGSGDGLTSSETPQQAVESAVSKLAAQSDVKLALSLPITAGQTEQLSAKGGDKPISAQEAKALTTATIFLNVATGNGEAIDSAQAQTDPQDSIDLGLAIGSDTPLEVVYAGQSLYVRAQLQQLLTDIGQDPSKVSELTNALNSLNGYVPGISQLGKGNWVEINHAGLQSLAPLLKQIESSAGTSANPSTLKADILQLKSQLGSALKANSTFASLGDDKYSVTLNVANFLATVKPAVQNALANIPDLGSTISSALSKAQSNVPAGQTAVIDVTLSNGQLKQADVDLNQFAGKNKVDFAVPLQVAFSSPGAPSAPSGATTLDVSKLPGLLGNLLGAQSTTAG